MEDISPLLYLIGAIGLYFLPWIWAEKIGHPQSAAIGALNLLLGWTFIGWVVALVWALTRQGREVRSA